MDKMSIPYERFVHCPDHKLLYNFSAGGGRGSSAAAGGGSTSAGDGRGSSAAAGGGGASAGGGRGSSAAAGGGGASAGGGRGSSAAAGGGGGSWTPSSKKSIPIIKLSSAIYVADRLLKQLAKYSIYLDDRLVN